MKDLFFMADRTREKPVGQVIYFATFLSVNVSLPVVSNR
jgi:hypothetical protein